MCHLKPHGIIACRTFAYFVQGSWWKEHPWLVPPRLATKQRTGKIQNQLPTIGYQQPSIIIMRVGSRSVLSKFQSWLTRGLNYLGTHGRRRETDGGQFSLATRLSRYDSVTRHIHKTTPPNLFVQPRNTRVHGTTRLAHDTLEANFHTN